MGVTTEQYYRLLCQLVPLGFAFDTEERTGEMSKTLYYLASWLKQADARAQIVLHESDPRAPIMLLTEWEQSLGLPDECTLLNATISERQQAVYAKISDEGGARIPRYLELAKNTGYPKASITRFKVHTCEVDCEQPITDFNWRFAWQLNLPKDISIKDSTCQSSAEDPIRTWGDNTIECIINREAQAIGHVIFAYIKE